MNDKHEFLLQSSKQQCLTSRFPYKGTCQICQQQLALEAAKEDTTALVVGPESFEQFKCRGTQGRHNFETWLQQMEKTCIEYRIPHDTT